MLSCNIYEDGQEKGSNNKRQRKRKRPMEEVPPTDGDGPEPEHGTSKGQNTDFFSVHFCEERLEDDLLLKRLQSEQGAVYAQRESVHTTLPSSLKEHIATLTSWGHSTSKFDSGQQIPTLDDGITFKRLLRLYHQLPPDVKKLSNDQSEDLYQFMGRYIDICCATREDYTSLICLHSLNHIMRTRNLVIANKQRLQKAKEQNQLDDELIEQCRDQGLARPKVLLLCPFRKNALHLVSTMKSLMFGAEERPFVQNSQRFEDEYGDIEGNKVHEKRKVSKEFKQLMSGNVDDCFHLGIGLAKKCLKLYTPLDESDILICSPLGLKILIGGEEEDEKKKKDVGKDEGGTYDFLASIEVLIIDRADVLLMQNWEHLMTVLASTNEIPVRMRTDITRVRHWSLRPGIARHFRQTILFSRLNFAEMHAIFANHQHCSNYAGLLTLQQNLQNPIPVKQISSRSHHEFHHFDAQSSEEQADKRFKYFIEKLLPKCDPGTMVFLPSYFDFVRLRNYLKRQQSYSFVQLHEYAEAGKVAKARQLFVRGERRLMLLTERFHYFFRYQIKGVRSLLFYQCPVNPEFYPELVEMATSLGQQTEDQMLQCRLLFCRFDVLRVQNIFGQEAAMKLLMNKNNDDDIQRLVVS